MKWSKFASIIFSLVKPSGICSIHPMSAKRLPPLFNRAVCPICLHKHSDARWTVCAECGTHGRSVDQSVVPIGRVWYIFKPQWGWLEMTRLGFAMVHDESTTPTRPRDVAPRTRQDDADSDATDKLYRQAGLKGNAL